MGFVAPPACGSFPDPGIEPMSLALASGFFPMDHQGHPSILCDFHSLSARMESVVDSAFISLSCHSMCDP